VFGRFLLVTQIAVSLVLVLAALLFGRTLSALHEKDAGYRRDHLLTLQLFEQAGTKLPQDGIAYYRQLADKVRALPGVEGVSYSSNGPANGFEDKEQVFDSLSKSPVEAVHDAVAPDFFSLVGMHLLAGRDVSWSDAGRPQSAAVISQSLADRLFGGQNPLGRTLYLGPHAHPRQLTIAGVVNSASLWKVESVRPLAVYTPYEPAIDGDEPLMDVRTRLDPRALKTSAEQAVRQLGHHYSLLTMTVDERLDSHTAIQRLTAMLSAFFGGVALLIACAGLYGLMSFHVTRCTAELGIRSALGARRRNLLALILREAMLLAVTGCGVGLALSFAAGRVMQSLLFGVTATDPAALAAAAGIMLAVAALAAFLPARRAAGVHPMIALRAD
jgi:predicted permease